ncbi:uncharacterized protein [Rutidosis leptorrhynchoides]|uniref:uncharacterized protein n=1 Tax=Rutidosis leptorrhynchoides TaxID=125765 RepID=UPI003A9A4097
MYPKEESQVSVGSSSITDSSIQYELLGQIVQIERLIRDGVSITALIACVPKDQLMKELEMYLGEAKKKYDLLLEKFSKCGLDVVPEVVVEEREWGIQQQASYPGMMKTINSMENWTSSMMYDRFDEAKKAIGLYKNFILSIEYAISQEKIEQQLPTNQQ